MGIDMKSLTGLFLPNKDQDKPGITGRLKARFTTWPVVFSALLISLIGMGGAVYAHNLQTKMVYMFFDPDTQLMLDERIAGNDPCFPDYLPPAPLLRGAGVCTSPGAETFPVVELGLIL